MAVYTTTLAPSAAFGRKAENSSWLGWFYAAMIESRIRRAEAVVAHHRQVFEESR